jgi:hypothetical protein
MSVFSKLGATSRLATLQSVLRSSVRWVLSYIIRPHIPPGESAFYHLSTDLQSYESSPIQTRSQIIPQEYFSVQCVIRCRSGQSSPIHSFLRSTRQNSPLLYHLASDPLLGESSRILTVLCSSARWVMLLCNSADPPANGGCGPSSDPPSVVSDSTKSVLRSPI